MRTKPDLTRANLVIDEYLEALRDPNNMPLRIASRTWVETRLEKHGVIPSMRGLRFGQSHAIRYACLVTTGRVREVSRAEKAVIKKPGMGSTEATIRKLLRGPARWISAVYLRELLEPHPALKLWKEMFEEAAASEPIVAPSYFVERSVFLDRCRARGIDCPQNPIQAMEWEEQIGLPKLARKTISAYHRSKGTTRDPMTAGALRFQRRTERQVL